MWGDNAATKAIFDALNIIYKEREKRGFIQLTLRSLAFTIGGLLVVLLSVGGIVIVPMALKVLGFTDGSTAYLLSLMRWPLLFVAILFALACLYRFGPSRERPLWRWVTWGSAVAAGIWIGGSLLLSWYVANFGSYNATYGSLGAIIGFLIWMWLSTIIVLAGADINAETEHQTVQDSTIGGGLPHVSIPRVTLDSGRSWPALGLAGAQRRAEQTLAARWSRAPVGDSRARNAA